MRLLHLESGDKLSIETFEDHELPPYAILSHAWGATEDESTFQEVIAQSGSSQDDRAAATRGKNKAGYAKVRFSPARAEKDQLKYFWIDSCCIDKTKIPELSEALNSMFRWYKDAAKCYVYLQDVSSTKRDDTGNPQNSKQELHKSRWFTRGWTLQELLAPRSVEFYSRTGALLGDKQSLERGISAITSIPVRALRGEPLSTFDVNERLRWSENRRTYRVEDRAYCLLGIFDVFIPFIYGEKDNAFGRLEDAINAKLSNLTG